MKNNVTITIDKNNKRYPYLIRWFNSERHTTYQMHCCEKTMDLLMEKYISLKTTRNES